MLKPKVEDMCGTPNPARSDWIDFLVARIAFAIDECYDEARQAGTDADQFTTRTDAATIRALDICKIKALPFYP